MAFRMAIVAQLLLILGILVSINAGFSSAMEDPPPVADALKTGCLTKDDCAVNEFCGGRGQTKRCIECVDCASVQRKPKMKTYDGEGCARHASECGECNPGYQETGGMCNPMDYDITPKPTQFERTNSGTDRHHQVLEEEKEVETATVTYLVVGLLVIIVAALLVVASWALKNGITEKRGNSRDLERAGLFNGAFDNPTAPLATLPTEYSQPPPAYTPPLAPPPSDSPTNWTGFENGRNMLPRRHTVRQATALPFARGNGSGSWTVRNEDAFSDDEIDGNMANGRDQDQGAEAPTNTNPGMPEGSETTGAAAASGSGEGSGNRHSRLGNSVVLPANSPPSRNESQNNVSDQRQSQGGPSASTPRSSFPGQMGDMVVGMMDFRFRLLGYPLAQHPSAFSPVVPPMQPQPRMIVSAPPSPRRIDDTHLSSLLEITGPFINSDASIDSGTGTDHDRSVPSRSVSGNDVRVSDIDIEMDLMDGSFYDSDSPTSPAALPEEEPPAVPDFGQEVEDMDQF